MVKHTEYLALTWAGRDKVERWGAFQAYEVDGVPRSFAALSFLMERGYLFDRHVVDSIFSCETFQDHANYCFLNS